MEILPPKRVQLPSRNINTPLFMSNLNLSLRNSFCGFNTAKHHVGFMHVILSHFATNFKKPVGLNIIKQAMLLISVRSMSVLLLKIVRYRKWYFKPHLAWCLLFGTIFFVYTLFDVTNIWWICILVFIYIQNVCNMLLILDNVFFSKTKFYKQILHQFARMCIVIQ